MPGFVETCLVTVARSAAAIERQSRGHPRAKRLLRLLADKKRILVTTHEHPDPDALASVMGMCTLLGPKLPQSEVLMSVKGRMGGGLNQEFINEARLKLMPWDDQALAGFDAIVLLDVQPNFAYSPLPEGTLPFAVVDHHRIHDRHLKIPFSDIRPEVGATSSIIFSYFMELETPIDGGLSAVLLFGIESDLAGTAGTPGELDNLALSALHLTADMPKLYRMRYVDLPQSYYLAYAAALQNAVYFDDAIGSYLGEIDSMEKPAVLADFLLRFDKVQWAIVAGLHQGRLILSLRTSSNKLSAAKLMTRMLRGLGEGGGHRTKAGGLIDLQGKGAAEVQRVRELLRKRFLRALGISHAKGQKLIP